MQPELILMIRVDKPNNSPTRGLLESSLPVVANTAVTGKLLAMLKQDEKTRLLLMLDRNSHSPAGWFGTFFTSPFVKW
jgi:hypothetical protein